MLRPAQFLRAPGIAPTAVVFLGAFVVRLIAIRLSFGEQFFFGKYLVLGEALRASGLIAERPFSYAPIYTYFIAVSKIVFGEALLGILIVQAVIGSISCVLMLWIARRLIGPSWGWLPAAAACVFRSFVLYDVTFLSDSLGLVFQLALLLTLLRIGPDSRWPAFACAGLLAGLSILHRPNNLLLLGLIALVWVLASSARRIAFRQACLMIAIALAVTLPVVMQNYRLTGAPGITASNPGYILYSSNNAASFGFRYSPPELFYRGAAYYERFGFGGGDGRAQGFMGDAEIATVISGAIEGRPMDLGESSRFYRRFTLAHALSYPAHYASLGLQKLWLSFNGYESHDVLPVFVRAERIAPVAPLRFAWVVPFGLLGLVLSTRRWVEFRWLYVVMLNNLVLLSVFYVVVRFRLPLEAMLLIFGGFAIKSSVEWLRAREFRRLALAALVLAGLAFGCNRLPSAAAERARSRSFEVMLEDAQRRVGRGDTAGAIARLEALIERDDEDVPRLFEAHRVLAGIYSRVGAPISNSAMKSPSYFEPDASLRRLETKSGSGAATFRELQYLASLYMKTNRLAEARGVLLEALARRPPEPLTRHQLARVEWASGDLDAAERQLRRAVDDGLLFTSDGLAGAWLLARIYREQGDVARAEEWTGQAVRLSILAPWVEGDPGVARTLAELRAAPGYEDPGPLETLIPLGVR